MEKRVYLQPVTKVLSVGANGDVCERSFMEDSGIDTVLYGPPGTFDESPLF